MEEKKQEEPKKLTYEELSTKFNELYIQYQKLTKMYQQAMAAMEDKNFEYLSFLLTSLFKVMDHPNRYPEKFINWVSKNIQDMVIGLNASLTPPEEPKKDESKEEKKDES